MTVWKVELFGDKCLFVRCQSFHIPVVIDVIHAARTNQTLNFDQNQINILPESSVTVVECSISFCSWHFSLFSIFLHMFLSKYVQTLQMIYMIDRNRNIPGTVPFETTVRRQAIRDVIVYSPLQKFSSI